MLTTTSSGVLAPTNEGAQAAEQVAAQWARVRGRLQTEVGDVIYKAWLRNMTLAGIHGDEAVILLPTDFHRDWVNRAYADRIAALWRAECPQVRRVELRAASADGAIDPD